VYQTYGQQVANGVAARMVLYQFDFLPGCAGLNLHGLDQLAKIACLLPHNGFPIIIERTPGNPGLAEARRLTVLNVLGHGPVPIPAERVVIGPSIALGLDGVEAEIIYFNLLSQDRSRGAIGLGGSGFSTAQPSAGAPGGGQSALGAGGGAPVP
jgi:hypothetical protein